MFGFLKSQKYPPAVRLHANIHQALMRMIVFISKQRDERGVEIDFLERFHLWVMSDLSVKPLCTLNNHAGFHKDEVFEIMGEHLDKMKISTPFRSISVANFGMSLDMAVWAASTIMIKDLHDSNGIATDKAIDEVNKACKTITQVLYQEARLWEIAP